MRFSRSSRLAAVAAVACLASVIDAQSDTTNTSTIAASSTSSPPPPPPSDQQAGTAPPVSQGTSAPAAPQGQGCLSYGIDFQNNGTYFINSASSDYFTAVNQFSGELSMYSSCSMANLTDLGCQPNTNASVWFVQPNGDELDCSELPTTPDYTNEMTTW